MNDEQLKAFAGAIGVIMGVLFAVSGFADAGKTDDLSKNQRIKNLIWLFGGAATVFLLDWNQFSKTELAPGLRAELFATYGACALISAAVAILAITVSIYLTIRRRAEDSPLFRGRAGEFVLEYVTYGYRYYRAQLDKLDQRAATSADPAQSLSALGVALSTLLATAALDRLHPNDAQREVFIDQALAAMEDTVKLFAYGVTGLELRTNYMAMVGSDEIGGLTPQFVDQPLDRYAGFLMLRRYRDGARDAVCLPVEPPTATSRVLPGAPQSVADRAACHLNRTKIGFRSGVQRAVRDQVKAYFRDAPYVSVLAVPLIWNRSVVGVVNVESSLIDVVGRGPDMIKRVGHALAPYCVIMGELVHRAEEPPQ